MAVNFRKLEKPALSRRAADMLRPWGITGDGNPKHSNWQALAHPKFRWYFAGSVASNFGTWLQNTAQVVLAYDLTHSAFAVGLVTCAQFSSPLVLGPWAAVLTHRIGNWRALVVTQIASAAIAAVLATLQFRGVLTVPWLLAGALAIGLAFTFALPAMSVVVAGFFSAGEGASRVLATKRALAMDSVSYNLGRALGPVLSVLVITIMGFGWAFAVNAGAPPGSRGLRRRSPGCGDGRLGDRLGRQ